MAEPFLKKDFASIASSLLDDLASGQGGRVAITDDTEGSVVRTLVEAFSRELAVCYAQLDQVYRLGYLDTADGASLDNVVALLGVTRRRGGYLQGTVTFTRAQPAPEEIPIPAGTRVSGQGIPPFATTLFASIPRGSTEVTVPIRSVERVTKPIEPATKLGPGALSVMPRPLLGIEGVTNRVQLIPEQQDETDAELRERARQEVGRAKLGTVEAIRLALGSLGLSRVEVQEPPDRPGTVEVLVGDACFGEEKNEELRREAARVVEESRPAGIRVRVQGARWVWLKVEATIELAQAYPASEQQAIEAELRRSIEQYVEDLGIGEDVREAKIRNLLAGHEKVREVHDPSTGDLLTVSGAGQRIDNEVVVGPTERARLEAIVLRLEPPRPPVFVDVELQLTSAVTGLEQMLQSALREHMKNLGNLRRTLSFSGLEGALPQDIKGNLRGIQFTVTHARNGQVVALVSEGDQDTIEEREQLQLRNVQVLGGGS